MKKHWKTILTVLLLSALLPVILLATEWRLPSLYGESYYAELSAMTERLYSVQGKKLVLVGGSNIAFGVDGNLLENLLAEKGFDYTVCPFGLYAALGTGAMLSLSEDALCPGDLVVLAMEPTAETLSCYFGAGAFWKCAETAPSLLMALKPAQCAAAAGSYIGYLQERTAIVRSQEWPRPEGAYRKDSFDADCTMRFVREGNTMPLGYDYADPIDLNALEIPADFAEEVNRYIQKAEKNGAQVVLSFSPMNRSAMTDVSEAVVWKYFSLCNDVFRCPVISDPNNYILDCGWFFDNNVHLNSAGAELRTYNLARDIFAFLGCYEPVEEEPLTMPASVAEPEDNAADNRFFVFAPTADNAAWIIWGLTDEGKKQTTLTAPSQIGRAHV